MFLHPWSVRWEAAFFLRGRRMSNDPGGRCAARTFLVDRTERAGGVTLGWAAGNHGLVDLKAKPWTGRKVQVAVARHESVGSDAPAHLLDRHEVLRNDKIWHACGGVDRGRQRERGRIVVVRRHRNGVGLCHGGDLDEFQDAPAVGHVRIDDVGRAVLEDGLEAGLGVESFARDDRN
jgi:hypothetical protein